MLNLPQRQGEPPKTHFGLPHEQLSQNPPADIGVHCHTRMLAARVGSAAFQRAHGLCAGAEGCASLPCPTPTHARFPLARSWVPASEFTSGVLCCCPVLPSPTII